LNYARRRSGHNPSGWKV